MKSLILTAVAAVMLASPAMANEQKPTVYTGDNGWGAIESSKNKMNDTVTHTTYLHATSKTSGFMRHSVKEFQVQCRGKSLVILGLTNGYIGNLRVKMEYRIDENKSKTIRPSVTTDGRHYFIDGANARALLADISKGSTLKVNSFNYNGTSEYSEFTNAGENFSAVRNVLNECKIKL